MQPTVRPKHPPTTRRTVAQHASSTHSEARLSPVVLAACRYARANARHREPPSVVVTSLPRECRASVRS
eukprot:scaffold216523_cov28-Tisochrysis_lutea.AAC.1